MQARYIHLRETQSTNSYLSKVAQTLPAGTIIHTSTQLAGRGQRGNTWESEPEKNITLSALLKPLAMEPRNQFYISEAVSLAILNVLSSYTTDITIKWPNDIYYKDKKIAGILIEHSLLGNSIDYTIVGVGININQLDFHSDAPNPVSLAQIIGSEVDLNKILHEIGDNIISYTTFGENYSFDNLHQDYIDNLYRCDGQEYPFSTPDGNIFNAKITNVRPDGFLILKHLDGTHHEYAFKEISFTIQ